MNEILKMPVGTGQPNDAQDVSIVQYMLNAARARRGTPKERLEVDGIFGPKTLAAIKEFQKRYCKVVDGRVNPHMETIRRLNHEAGHFIAFSDNRGYLDTSNLA